MIPKPINDLFADSEPLPRPARPRKQRWTRHARTPADYLNRMTLTLARAEAKALARGMPYPEDHNLRATINTLVVQRVKGVGTIADNEDPEQGVMRLHGAAKSDAHRAILALCLRWLVARRAHNTGEAA